MKKYLGVKIVSAEPAWKLGVEIILKSERKIQNKPENWLEGYKVVYEDGYESWSPKEVFEKAYKCIGGLEENLALSVNISSGEWRVDCPILGESSRASQPEPFKDAPELRKVALQFAIESRRCGSSAKDIVTDAEKLYAFLTAKE